MSDEISYFFLLLLLLLQFVLVRPQCPAQRIVQFDDVRPTTKTPVFCAVTHSNVITKNTQLTDCSMELNDCSMELFH